MYLWSLFLRAYITSLFNKRNILLNLFVIRIYSVYIYLGQGVFSRYSDWLRAGRSWDRIPVGRRDFSHTSRPALGPTQSPVHWVPGLSRGVKRLERGADHPPLLAPRSRMSRAILLLSLWAFGTCYSANFTTLYIYSIYITWVFRV
jgi:hypothetical protein